MLEVLFNIICGYLLALLGYYIIKKITNSDIKLNKYKHLLLLINGILIVLIHFINYSIFSPIIIFVINTTTFKIIFKNNFEESLLLTGILSLFILISDIFAVTIQSIFLDPNQIQENFIIYIVSNIAVIGFSFLLIQIKFISNNMRKSYEVLNKKDLHLNVVFIILLIVASSGIIFKISTNYKFNLSFISNVLLIGSLVSIAMVYINNKNTYHKLSKEYDILLSSIVNFEDWIEKEQYIRHEYKNQLAIIYALSSEKEVKNKIEEIIEQNMKIESNIVKNLKILPKGLKGLLYYKTIIAKKYKVNLTVDVSIKDNSKTLKMEKEKITELSKLIGIFFDNAIEAAKESRKKNILLEIYELKNGINIVISNTFKKNSIIKDNYKKGVSSKGKGRGNGLYFAKQILNKNDWLEEKREIIDNYYIETIVIKKNTSKK